MQWSCRILSATFIWTLSSAKRPFIWDKIKQIWLQLLPATILERRPWEVFAFWQAPLTKWNVKIANRVGRTSWLDFPRTSEADNQLWHVITLDCWFKKECMTPTKIWKWFSAAGWLECLNLFKALYLTPNSRLPSTYLEHWSLKKLENQSQIVQKALQQKIVSNLPYLGCGRKIYRDRSAFIRIAAILGRHETRRGSFYSQS